VRDLQASYASKNTLEKQANCTGDRQTNRYKSETTNQKVSKYVEG